MVLIEQCRVCGKVLVQEGLDLSIAGVWGNEFVPCQDTSSVSISHEVGVASSVDEDGIHCLGSEAL
jgi:hypothetical protein